MTIAGETVTITQAGTPCTYTLSPTSLTVPSSIRLVDRDGHDGGRLFMVRDRISEMAESELCDRPNRDRFVYGDSNDQ